MSPNRTLALSGGSSPCVFNVKYLGQDKKDYAICSGTSCGNPTTSDLCPNSDFLVSAQGTYASNIERADIWRPSGEQGPYLINFVAKGGSYACNALGQTVTITIAMRECPQAKTTYQCRYAGDEWKITVAPKVGTTYQDNIIVHLDAWVTPCGDWLEMSSTDCYYINGVISGTSEFYNVRDIDFTKGIKVRALEGSACDNPASAHVEDSSIDVGARTLTVTYDPNYC